MSEPMPEKNAATKPARIKVDIVVHGRFHGFALARALLALGHDAIVHTNYPALLVERFGLPRKNVRSFAAHGVATRAANRMGRLDPRALTEPAFHCLFGRWAVRSVRKEADIVYGFSGVMEELLLQPRTNAKQLRAIVRGSTHIREQARLLEEEETRVGVPIDRPSTWMIAREEREYALADCVFVLSRFAYDSFLSRDFPAGRVLLHPLGVDLALFRPTAGAIEAREQRILSGAPLKVLNVGTLNARKGTYDLLRIAAELKGRIDFTFVGTTVKSEVGHLLSRARSAISIRPRVAESELPKAYADSDIFVFTTVEDGFAAVILQAAAAGLPVIATTNCSAPDFVTEGETGWILPIRDQDAFVRRLRWCDENRQALARVAKTAVAGRHAHDWEAMAGALVEHYHRMMTEGHRS
jgi:glycosyltransferase involved in cell wall biosynthesis